MKAPLMNRCLINSILYNENFNEIEEDKEAITFSNKHDINTIINEGKNAIENKKWTKVIEQIEKIKTIFKIKDEDDYEITTITIGGLIQGKAGDKDAKGMGIKPGDTLGDVTKFMQPSSAWDKGEGIKGPSRDIVGEAAFEDMTKQAFKELLNIKEKRIVYEGMKLNTDEITSFYTGDIETLFHDEDIIKVKKSKIAFCLDASGSMSSVLRSYKKQRA
jgi:hypothetical protein